MCWGSRNRVWTFVNTFKCSGTIDRSWERVETRSNGRKRVRSLEVGEEAADGCGVSKSR
jgi:hypothetical protein